MPNNQLVDFPVNTERRFGGVIALYGKSAFDTFQRAHVAVIGLGGVGSWAAEALARSGIGKLTLIDLDNIAESNINRQIHALDETLGAAKVTVMARRIHGINRRCVVRAIEDFITPDNLTQTVTPDFNYVIDCIDNYRTKAALIQHCKRNKIKLITVGGAGGQTDPTRIKIADLARAVQDPLLAKTRKLLRRAYGFTTNPARRFDQPCVYSEEPPFCAAGAIAGDGPAAGHPAPLSCAGGIGSAATVTAAFGLAAASHVLGKLARRPRPDTA